MLPELARHSDFRAMFLGEGQIVRSIDHPNVVKVHEVSEDRGILYMAMQWVEGDSLRALIKEAKRRRAIPAEMAVKIIADHRSRPTCRTRTARLGRRAPQHRSLRHLTA